MNTRLSTAQWLTTDLPATRTQARLGALYRLLRRLLANPIGLAGLILVGLIVLMALLAPGLPLAGCTVTLP